MKYMGLPFAVWRLFCGSFKKNLPVFFNVAKADTGAVTAKAKGKYKEIIGNLPTFEKGDRFQTNIVGSAMLGAVVLSLPERPEVKTLTEYYRNSMMTAPMKLFCRMSGKKKFTSKDVAAMRKTAAFRAADRNSYSWNMDFLPYADGSGYEARFTKCGICTLMRELGLFDLVPAMCALDYAMSEAGGASIFVREYTLAKGDGYCDCGYKKRAGK